MSYKNFIILLFFFPVFNVLAQNKAFQEKQNKKQINPDICLVTGRIIKILPAGKKSSGQSCKQAPCFAIIKIIKVEKTGRSFPEKFISGQKIKVKFLLSKKAAEKNLSGLKKRTVFKAEIKAKPKMNSNSSDYLIKSYKIL